MSARAGRRFPRALPAAFARGLALVLALCTLGACSGAGTEASAAPAARTGTIEFGLVAPSSTLGGPGRDEYPHWNAGGNWAVPDERIWVLERPLLVCRVASAELDVDAYGFPALAVTLVPSDAQVLREFTRAAIGRRLAVLVDGQVIIAPVLADPLDQTFLIQAYFSEEDASLLRSLLAPPQRR